MNSENVQRASSLGNIEAMQARLEQLRREREDIQKMVASFQSDCERIEAELKRMRERAATFKYDKLT